MSEIVAQQQEAEEGYIKTTTHNYVSRKATIDGAKQVEIKGRSILQDGVHVRGDLAIVRIGRYCEIDSFTLLEPPMHPQMKEKYIPLVIGSHTHIGTHCKILAAAIGSMVWIGDHVQLGKRCIIKDNCVLEAGVVLGDDTVVPPFTRISVRNPTMPQELPPSVAVQLQEISLDRYQEFKQAQRSREQR
jgi:dynactin-5